MNCKYFQKEILQSKHWDKLKRYCNETCKKLSSRKTKLGNLQPLRRGVPTKYLLGQFK